MNEDDKAHLVELSAVDMASGMKRGEFTSRELVQAHLDRTAALNPDLGAYAEVLGDSALESADQADAARRTQGTTGPLHGVPFSVKQNIDVAGTATTWGVPLLAENTATADAPIVSRMRSAGAIVLARSNMPDFALRFDTESSGFGRTRNPRWSELTAGGSSGGDAAAVAAGLTPIGLGNDLGGSLRNPAFACGVVGLRPTVGIVADAATTIPDVPNLALRLMNVQGPLARSVDDVETVLDIVAGFDPRDPGSVPRPAWDRPTRGRVAIMSALPTGETADDVASAVREASRRLAAYGYEVDTVTPPHWDESATAWKILVEASLAPSRDLLLQLIGPEAEQFVSAYDTGRTPPAAELLALLEDRVRWQVAWSTELAAYDAVITPVWRRTPFAPGEDLVDPARVLDTVSPVLPASFLGLPAVSVPCAPAGARAHGVQVIGHRYEDRRCLDIARIIENG